MTHITRRDEFPSDGFSLPHLDTSFLPQAPLREAPRTPSTESQRGSSERLHTFRALSWARQHALRLPALKLSTDRYVILSDLHLGDKRSHADDFAHNERVTVAAMAHYFDGDYRLVLNGDVEECWKNAYRGIEAAYGQSIYQIEREFLRKGPGYHVRIFGNHDDDWADPRRVQRHLDRVLGAPVRVHPGVLLGDRIFIAHGHQGDLNSDRRAWLSRRIIRYLWRPLQSWLRVTSVKAFQPHPILQKREQYLYEWARLHRYLLIAGHTHRLMLLSLVDSLRDRWRENAPYTLREIFGRRAPDSASPVEADALLAADGPVSAHYLNSGCCVHTDCITGIEIDRGELRLVQWAEAGLPLGARIERRVLHSADLGHMLARLGAAAGPVPAQYPVFSPGVGSTLTAK